MSISPISSSMPVSGIGGVAATPQAPASKASFSDMFQHAMEKVETQQDASAAAVTDLLTGKSQDVIPVVSAVAQADLSFKLLIGVRNKVIEAYKQTMNIQV